MDEAKAYQRKRSSVRDELQSESVDDLNAELRKAGIAPEDLGSGDPEKDAVDAAVLLVHHGVPIHSNTGNYKQIREAVKVIFGLRSHLSLRTAIEDNVRLFKKTAKHQGARLALTPTGLKRLAGLRRGKDSKKAVQLVAAQVG